MSDVTENTVEEVEVVEFIDAAGIEAAQNNLMVAQELSDELDSGLDTQAAIKKTSVALRNVLLHVSRSLHKEYTSVIERRDNLLENVGEVQAASKKASLLKKKAELEAQLAAL
jgi:hypothetical protein